MKASRTELLATIKREFKVGRDWSNQDWGRYYKMMIDVSNGKIWVDTFMSENDWSEYRSDTIKQLSAGMDLVAEMEQSYLADAIDKLRSAGWEITE